MIAGVFYLHEGSGKTRKTGADKVADGEKMDRLGAQAFPPMPAERADNGGDGIFVNTGLLVQDFFITGMLLIGFRNRSLNFQGDLGIRDHRV